MCMCGKPTINGEPGYSWDGENRSIRPPNPPATEHGETVIYDEPGRCGGLDSHERHYRLVRDRVGGIRLRVRHGGGDESVFLCATGKTLLPGLAALDSTARYWILNTISHAYRDGKSDGAAITEVKWRTAAAQKRIKTRKMRGHDFAKVWIAS